MLPCSRLQMYMGFTVNELMLNYDEYRPVATCINVEQLSIQPHSMCVLPLKFYFGRQIIIDPNGYHGC